MLLNLLISTLLTTATTAIHGVGMMVTLKLLHHQEGGLKGRLQKMSILWISAVVVLMFAAHTVETTLWAAAYLALGAIDGIENALYFSMVTFTTLGYGDITLPARWRLISSFEAATGIIMFGWTTAIVIATVQHVFFGTKLDVDPD